jgi:hypothetical protein
MAETGSATAKTGESLFKTRPNFYSVYRQKTQVTTTFKAFRPYRKGQLNQQIDHGLDD